jgi:hypothetical protein
MISDRVPVASIVSIVTLMDGLAARAEDQFSLAGLIHSYEEKRSPHEATCPRIAPDPHQGRIMSAAVPISFNNLSLVNSSIEVMP